MKEIELRTKRGTNVRFAIIKQVIHMTNIERDLRDNLELKSSDLIKSTKYELLECIKYCNRYIEDSSVRDSDVEETFESWDYYYNQRKKLLKAVSYKLTKDEFAILEYFFK